jgi:hypothetical protein
MAGLERRATAARREILERDAHHEAAYAVAVVRTGGSLVHVQVLELHGGPVAGIDPLEFGGNVVTGAVHGAGGAAASTSWSSRMPTRQFAPSWPPTAPIPL